MATVYIVSDAGHDYSTAAARGTLVFLWNSKINVFASDQLVKDIAAKLMGSQPEDFLLPSGNSLATCTAFAHLLLKHGKVNMLIYSFRNEVYEARTIRLEQCAASVGAK